MMALTGIERPGRGPESVLVSGVSRPVQDLQARSLTDMLGSSGVAGTVLCRLETALIQSVILARKREPRELN
jgi:hypothetical protein